MEQNVVDNEVRFLDLLVAIETSNQHLSLLLAVCDRDRLRNFLTERYEEELASEGIKSYRVMIDRQEPSLFAAINQLVEAEPYLQAGNPAVITVEGVASLSSFASEGERSPVDKFLGYLQWTREGMRQFAFPIVIWVTEHIHNEISRKAQDFYSWREGVFFFESMQEEPIEPIDVEPIDLPDPESDDLDLPIDELLVYIAQREATGQEDVSLATFYTLLARAYKRDNQIDQAISIWQKAIALQEKLNLSLELAASLNSLGILYDYQGKYRKAEPLYLRSLEIRKQQLGADQHYIDERERTKGIFRVSIVSSLVGLCLLTFGIFGLINIDSKKPHASSGIVAIVGVMLQAVTVLALNLGKKANERMDKYYKELYNVRHLEILLSNIYQHYKDAREQSKSMFRISVLSSLVGLCFLSFGIFGLINKDTKDSQASSRIAAIVGAMLQAVTVIALNREKEANERMDKYHKELYDVHQLEILLSSTEQDHPYPQTVTSSLMMLKLQLLTGLDPATLEQMIQNNPDEIMQLLKHIMSDG